MAARKRKQSIFSLCDEPIEQPPPGTSRRTPNGRRVYNGDVQQIPSEFAISGGNHMVNNNTLTSEFVEIMPQNTSHVMNETSAEENGYNMKDKKAKKTRGPTLMLEIWGRSSTMPRIQVDFDSFGRPIGPNRSKFCEFLGTIARNGMYCPLDVEDWHKMPNEYKKKMLNVVKSRYEINPGDESWILASICKKWRNWKSTQKTKYFVEGMNVELLSEQKDERVMQDQWIKLLTFWNKEEVKARSQKNKDARSKKNMNHLTGKEPFAQVYHKLAKEKDRAPSRAELLDACYASDKNTSLIVSQYLEEIEERRKELPEGSADPVGPDDLYAQVRGQDRPGRVRMFGEGVSPSDVWGEIPNRNNSKRIMLEQRVEILNMKDQISKLQSQLLTQERVTCQGARGSTSLSNNLPRPTFGKQALRVGDYVALKSLFDQTKTVGEGYVRSIGPNAELEEKWCQIQVNVVLQNDEPLIKPRDFYETLGETQGEIVLWPCNLVAITQFR